MSPVHAGIDLGGTTLRIALVEEGGRVAAERVLPTRSHAGPQDLVERAASALDELAAELGARPVAVGVGCPGSVDRTTGVVGWLPNFPDAWRGTPLGRDLELAVGVPVRLGNDVRVAALGELHHGHGRGRSRPSFFLVTLGTGVGGALVIDGVVRHGRWGGAGEIGHLPIVADGPRCGCGSRGCLETVASAPALIGEATRLLHSGRSPELHRLVLSGDAVVSPETISLAADRGDEAMQDLLERYADTLAIGLTAVVLVAQPSALILAGGVAGIGEPLRQSVERQLRRRVHLEPMPEMEVRLSELEGRSGVLGAAVLAALDDDTAGSGLESPRQRSAR